jgi:hypothetical protein
VVALGCVLAAGRDRPRRLPHLEAVPLTGRYRGFFAPLILIAGGVLVLLANLDYIKWDSLLRLLDLWPVVLILVGIQIIAGRTLPASVAAATGTAAVALALIGAILYVALAPPLPPGTQRDFSDKAQGLSKATLELDLGSVRLDVRGAQLGTDLYQAHFDFPQGEVPRSSLDRSAATVHVESGDYHFGWFGFGGRRQATIKLNESIAWAIRVNSGASHQVLELSRVQVTRVDVDGGASHLELTLGKPSGEVPITINGGASHVVIHRPPGTPVRIRVSGGASSLSADGTQLAGHDELGWDSGYAGASDRYDIKIEGGASHVTLDTG